MPDLIHAKVLAVLLNSAFVPLVQMSTQAKGKIAYLCCENILTEWHVGSWFHDQGLSLCPWQWKRGVLTIGPPGKSPSTNLKLKPKSFMMAWRAPQGLALVFSVTSFATTVIACSCCHPGFLAVPKICQMCSCLRAFALAVLISLT